MLRLKVFLLGFFLTSTVLANPVQDLDKVGSARLKVLLWNIYESALYTPSGEFAGIEPGLALEIEYKRNISKTDFIDYARDEWQKQSLYTTENELWLSSLRTIFPSVRKGDRLVLKVDDSLHSQFFYNGQFIGELNNTEFTEEFLAIWLSEQTSYPKLRNQLVGATR